MVPLLQKEGILQNNINIKVPNDDLIKGKILNIHHNSKLPRVPGQADTWSLFKRGFTFPSMTAYLHPYLNSCDSFQHVKLVTKKSSSTLESRLIPAGPWMDITNYLLTCLLISNKFDGILTVIDMLRKINNFILFKDTMGAKTCTKTMGPKICTGIWEPNIVQRLWDQ